MKESKIISILTKELTNELNAQEKAELADYTGSPEFDFEREAFNNAWSSAGSYGSQLDIDVDIAFSKFATKFDIPVSENATKEADTNSKGRNLFLLVAAAILLVLAGLLTFNQLSVNKHAVSNDTNIISEVTLDNGTKATLAPNSVINKLDDNDVNSGVSSTFSLQGRALVAFGTDEMTNFSLASAKLLGSKSDFTVSAKSAKLGIENYSSSDIAEIAVESGTAELITKDGVLTLSAGQLVKINKKTGKFALDSANKNDFSWVTKTLSFNNTPIDQVIVELEKFFEVEIDIIGEVPQQCHFTAENINNPTIKEVFETLHTSFNLGVKRTSLTSYQISDISCK